MSQKGPSAGATGTCNQTQLFTWVPGIQTQVSLAEVMVPLSHLLSPPSLLLFNKYEMILQSAYFLHVRIHAKLSSKHFTIVQLIKSPKSSL